MTETQLKNNVLAMIRRDFGQVVRAFKIHDQFTAGIPDLLICANGKFIGIELKKNEAEKAAAMRKVTLQGFTLMEIRRAGGTAEYCCCVSEVREIIRRVLEGRTGNIGGFDAVIRDIESVSVAAGPGGTVLDAEKPGG